jgi:molybdopterin-binding protein
VAAATASGPARATGRPGDKGSGPTASPPGCGRRSAVGASVSVRYRPARDLEDTMELSARNQLQGTVKSVTLGAVMAEVVVDVNGQEIVSAITRGSAERLGLCEGSAVTVIIKSTDVLLATDQA